jgi:hypothetical protein
MEPSDAFRLVNLFVAAAMAIGGIGQFFSGSFNLIILGIYVLLFAACVAALEFQIPPQVSRHANFLFSFWGRGAFYFFCACLMPNTAILWNIAAIVVGVVGLGYIGLHFVPAIEPPANMREADAGWGAEQV